MKNYATALITVLALGMIGCGGSSSKSHYPDDNRPPSAKDGSFVTQADTELTAVLRAVDENADSLTFSLVGEPTNGSVEVKENGSFSYSPNVNVTGSDSFTFRVSDGDLESNVASVEIVIEPLEVSFSTYSRQAFEQIATDEPLSLNSRVFVQDVTEPNAYDDLLTQ